MTNAVNVSTLGSAMVANSSGNVGIGTSSPTARMHLMTSSGTTALTMSTNNNQNANVTLYDDATNFGIGTNFGSTGVKVTMNLQTPDSTMAINSSGYVAKQYQPAFYAYPSGEIPASASTVLAFNSTMFNVGSCYSTSTYRFTAPLAGRYVFEQQSLAQGSSSMLDVSLRINGSAYTNFRTYSADAQVGGGVVVSLAANDYVDFYRSYTDRNTYPGPIWSFFSGYFLG
jgi:C1q domain